MAYLGKWLEAMGSAWNYACTSTGASCRVQAGRCQLCSWAGSAGGTKVAVVFLSPEGTHHVFFLADKLKFYCKIQPSCSNHRLFYGRYAGELCQIKLVMDSHLHGSRSYKVCAVQIVICCTFWTRHEI